MQDRYVDVGTVRTRYREAGSTGSTVLLLHGIGCSVLEWSRNIDALAAHHRVVAIDLLGFGLTDKPSGADYTIGGLTRFVLDAMQALGIVRAHLAGNSLGGRLALECAVVAPGRVASLVLADPAGMARRGTLPEFRLATLPVLGELVTAPTAVGTRLLWRKAFARPDAFVTDELVATKLALARQPGAQAAFLKTLRSFLDVGGFRPEPVARLQAGLPGITAPALVLWGREDQFVAPAHAEVLRQGLRRADVQLWEHCGHAPQIECAGRFNDAALRFWRGVDAAVPA